MGKAYGAGREQEREDSGESQIKALPTEGALSKSGSEHVSGPNK